MVLHQGRQAMDEVTVWWASGMLLLVLPLVMLWGWARIRSGRNRQLRQDRVSPEQTTLGPIRYVVPPGGSWMHPHSAPEGSARHRKAADLIPIRLGNRSHHLPDRLGQKVDPRR